jgi:glyoxalase family protein
LSRLQGTLLDKAGRNSRSGTVRQGLGSAADHPAAKEDGVKLEGIHHITAITADAQQNVDFYAGLLGLRMVKKTVNFDAPDVYHLYYGDELGHGGSVITFFEFPGAPRGRAGAGMVHRITWRVRGVAALDFWADRLGASGVAVERDGDAVRFRDPEGLDLEIAVVDSGDAPLVAATAGVPAEHALTGFDGVCAYSSRPDTSRPLFEEGLGFTADGEAAWTVAGDERHGSYALDPAPPERGIQGAGTVHHIAWASRDEDHLRWRQRARDAGAHVTPVIDRDYFESIYFREPSGVLFEIATLSPGFTVDEPADHLGESLQLPKRHEHLRERLERTLTPLRNPRVDIS